MKTQNCFFKTFIAGSIAILLLVTSSLQAQTMKARLGVKGGVNFSQLYIDQPDIDKENWKVGLNAGIYGIAPIGDLFFIQPELLYSSLGTKATYKGSNLLGIDPGEVRFNLNYIQLPILASLSLGVLSIQAGPYFSYLVNANISNLKTDGTVTDARGLNKDDFNRVDYGVAAGVALNINAVQVGVRYNYGLREVGKSNFGQKMTRDSKNVAAQAYIGIGFGGK